MFPKIGKHVEAATYFNISEIEKFQAHCHVLVNCKDVDPFYNGLQTFGGGYKAEIYVAAVDMQTAANWLALLDLAENRRKSCPQTNEETKTMDVDTSDAPAAATIIPPGSDAAAAPQP
ncbi:hypothetical protein PIB30_046598 [Stylosanthes scabra]|uniref:Uncharacterized protein n=1 Tax=Stylosanthes scabra TaxID=79078 RepID=A0ABU6RGI5_9FABA|nr:hypothetical protein [Stylosanthes scabra]